MQSEWAELFIRYSKFWGGEPSEENLAMIYTRKPRPPFREVAHGDGTSQKARPFCSGPCARALSLTATLSCRLLSRT